MISEHPRGRLAQGLEGGPIENCHNAPRCGAARRHDGQPCERAASRGRKRCALHGGASTGPRTEAGRERCREAATIHGYYSAQSIAERKQARQSIRQTNGVIAILSGKRPTDLELGAMSPAILDAVLSSLEGSRV